jgi:hypothetical protein
MSNDKKSFDEQEENMQQAALEEVTKRVCKPGHKK